MLTGLKRPLSWSRRDMFARTENGPKLLWSHAALLLETQADSVRKRERESVKRKM